VLNVAVLALGKGIYGMLTVSLAVNSLTLAYMAWVVLGGAEWRKVVDVTLLKKVIKFAAPLGMSSLSLFVINYGDRFFLQRHVSLSELGVYSLAYKAGLIVAFVQLPFDTYWNAQMFTVARSVRGDLAFSRVCTYITLCGGFLTLAFVVLAEPVLRVAVSPAYVEAALYAPWIAAAYTLRAIANCFLRALQVAGRTGKDSLVNIVSAGVCLFSYAVLIPRYAIWGAVAGTVIGFGTMLMTGWWQAQKWRPFPYQYSRLTSASVIALGLGTAFRLFRPHVIRADVALGAGCLICHPILLVLCRFFDADEKATASAAGGYILRSLGVSRAGIRTVDARG
jgi:O-antigen/teichoic acid export membrane protein